MNFKIKKRVVIIFSGLYAALILSGALMSFLAKGKVIDSLFLGTFFVTTILFVLASFFMERTMQPLMEIKKILIEQSEGMNGIEFTSKKDVDVAEAFRQLLDQIRAKQREELAEEENKFIGLIEAAPLCIKILDQNGRLKYMNKRGREEHFIKNDADLSDWDWLKTMKEKSQQAVKKSLGRALTEGQSSKVEIEHVGSGSNAEWCLSIISPVKDNKGNVSSVLVISEDITSMKKVEKEKQADSKTFRTLIDAMPICIKLFDSEGKLVLINKHGIDEHYLEGKNDDEIRKWNYNDGLSEDNQQKVQQAIGLALEGQSTSLQIQHLPGAARTEWVSSTFVPIKNSSGAAVNVLYISRDITEEKRIEAERNVSMKRAEDTKSALYSILEDVKESEKNLQDERDQTKAVISSMGEGLMMVDSNLRIVFLNEKACQIFNVRPEQMVGTNIQDSVRLFKGDIELRGKDRALFRMVTDGEMIVRSMKEDFFYFCPISNRKFPVEIVATPLKQDDKITGAVIVFKDITEIKALDEAKNSFISIASHQLRTPVTSIRWYAEMLNSGDAGKLEKSQAEFVDRIYNSALKLGRTINMLLSLARIESGKTKIENQAGVDLRAITDDILHQIEPDLKAKNITVTINQKKLPVIVGDATMLQQAIMNYLTNAVRYTEINGNIEVNLSADKNEVTVSVKDDGIGVPEKEKSKIFEKFYRAPNAITKVPNGSGLGLSLVKSLAELWGGRSGLNSPATWKTKNGKEKLQGSEFYFTIPVVKSEEKIPIVNKKEVVNTKK